VQAFQTTQIWRISHKTFKGDIAMKISKIVKAIRASEEYKTCINCEQNNAFHLFNVGEHMNRAYLNSAGYTGDVRVAALLHDIGKPVVKFTRDGVDHFYNHAKPSVEIAERILRPMVGDLLDEEELRQILILIGEHDYGLGFGQALDSVTAIRGLVQKYGSDLVWDLLHLIAADVGAQNLDKHQSFQSQYDAAITVLRYIGECRL